MDDSPKEECGVVGVYSTGEAAETIYYGLHALQHRGQEAAGIAVSDGQAIRVHKKRGLVNQVFKPGTLQTLPGQLGIGHTRYSTTGGDNDRNIQPYVLETMHGPLAVAHNGNLSNSKQLREQLLKEGAGLTSSSDTELMTLMLASAEGDTWEERLANTMPKWEGAYTLVVLSATKMLACRDPWGFRPLSTGRLPNGGHAVASETGALQTMGATSIKPVDAGQIVTVCNRVMKFSQGTSAAYPQAYCAFEQIYFSRPDANWGGHNVHTIRQRLGKELAKQAPVDADLVIGVPDSGTPAAIGYATQTGIPYGEGFTKNRYIGRTFINPTQKMRSQGVKHKFNALPDNLKGKRIIMVDDSIVRGTTAGPIIQLLKEAGATEIHVRITCPPIIASCHYGVDMGNPEQLIANQLNVNEIKEHIGATTLEYLTLPNLMNALQATAGYCLGCFTNKYPTPVQIISKNSFGQTLG